MTEERLKQIEARAAMLKNWHLGGPNYVAFAQDIPELVVALRSAQEQLAEAQGYLREWVGDGPGLDPEGKWLHCCGSPVNFYGVGHEPTCPWLLARQYLVRLGIPDLYEEGATKMSEFKQWYIEYDESGWPFVSDGKRVITSDIGGDTQQEDVAIAEQIVSDHNTVSDLQRQLREAQERLALVDAIFAGPLEASKVYRGGNTYHADVAVVMSLETYELFRQLAGLVLIEVPPQDAPQRAESHQEPR